MSKLGCEIKHVHRLKICLLSDLERLEKRQASRMDPKRTGCWIVFAVLGNPCTVLTHVNMIGNGAKKWGW